MLWVALATAIMILTGEVYDQHSIAKLFAALRVSITESIAEGPDRKRALRAAAEFEQAFEVHRRDLRAYGECVKRADAKYAAARGDYTVCAERLQAQRNVLRRNLDVLEREYEAALSPAQHARVLTALRAKPAARMLDPAVLEEPVLRRARRRSRGIEGVVSQRHLTLPRNVVSIVYGPLAPPTFGQRFPSRIIDAGTSYAHSDAPDGVESEWFTRVGLRFGLFDDIEAGVILPFRLAPELDFNPALVSMVRQFRMGAVNLVLRLSFQTPGEPGWAVSPGTILKVRGRQIALQAGIFAPMELGTFLEPETPVGGLNAPLRLTWNIVPALFVVADSGVVYDDLHRPDGLTVPLGFGAGYTRLMGSRLLEITTSFTWDRWFMPTRPNAGSDFQPGIFRVAFGASFSFQAL